VSEATSSRAEAATEDAKETAERPSAHLRRACRLGRHCLLLAFEGELSAGEGSGTQTIPGAAPQKLEVRSLGYGTDEREDGGPAGALLALVPSQDGQAVELRGDLSLEVEGVAVECSEGELERAGADPRALARDSLAGLETSSRGRVVSFLADLASAAPLAAFGTASSAAVSAAVSDVSIAEDLFAFREALRERLPLNAISEESSQALDIELIMAIDDRSFYVAGRMRDTRADIVRLTAVSPEGARAELATKLFEHRRAHAVQASTNRRGRSGPRGFVCFFELPAPSLLAKGWVFELENAAGTASEFQAPEVISRTSSVRDALLDDPVRDRLPNDRLMLDHVHPAISRIQEQVAASVEIVSVTQLGTPPDAPEMSVVIPLYQRIDLLEIQLAELVRDPELFSADVVYVLDSPEQADQLLDLAANLAPIYPLPFRVAVLRQNVGFAGANNAGAALARGRLLVLMNSDVLPAAPGWLSRLCEFYDRTPDIGALGPKLLYEDDTIQHAGMYFHQPPGSSAWLDAHYFRGLNRLFPAANEARPVPTVSGACLTIDRELYRQLGGLRGIYVRGDYEDTDLCLRLRGEGRQNWYLPSVELYHLEAQSYSPSLRKPANRYNMWLHTQLWRGEIETIIDGHRAAEEPARR
jgi:GT2 family glycosyltransferase